tara:strand:- start:2965 stop:3351 length:387 start_codon:yes stop_codon:yes gene_type:complete
MGLGAALVITGAAFKLHVDKAEAEREALMAQLQVAINNEAVLKGTITDQNQRITQALEDQKVQQEKIRGLESDNQKAVQEVTNLRAKFAKHDLNMLSLRKPGLIAKIINKGTKEVGDELAAITDPDRP